VARRREDASLIPVGGGGTVVAVHRPASCRLAEKDGGHGAMPSSGVSDDTRRGELNGVNFGQRSVPKTTSKGFENLMISHFPSPLFT
jgi:hypothetical protein